MHKEMRFSHFAFDFVFFSSSFGSFDSPVVIFFEIISDLIDICGNDVNQVIDIFSSEAIFIRIIGDKSEQYIYLGTICLPSCRNPCEMQNTSIGHWKQSGRLL